MKQFIAMTFFLSTPAFAGPVAEGIMDSRGYSFFDLVRDKDGIEIRKTEVRVGGNDIASKIKISATEVSDFRRYLLGYCSQIRIDAFKWRHRRCLRKVVALLIQVTTTDKLVDVDYLHPLRSAISNFFDYRTAVDCGSLLAGPSRF